MHVNIDDFLRSIMKNMTSFDTFAVFLSMKSQPEFCKGYSLCWAQSNSLFSPGYYPNIFSEGQLSQYFYATPPGCGLSFCSTSYHVTSLNTESLVVSFLLVQLKLLLHFRMTTGGRAGSRCPGTRSCSRSSWGTTATTVPRNISLAPQNYNSPLL